jgi:hypothetical protein
MINGRAKGHAFERDLIRIFRDEFGSCADHLKRNLEQYQDKGHGDIVFHNLMIEAKRYAKGSWHKDDWWDQACVSAKEEYVPILIYKYDYQPARMVFPLKAIAEGQYIAMNGMQTITTDFSTGIMIMRDLLEVPIESNTAT